MNDDLRYPIGRFRPPKTVDDADRHRWIDAIARLPAEVRRVTDGLERVQLDTPYRDGGWTPRQIVHHLADSHMNAVNRFRLALTEDGPTIRPYNQGAYAELADSHRAEIETSLAILAGLHARWVVLLERFSPEDWTRTFVHPESGRAIELQSNLALYAWHGAHHAMQIERLRERERW